jgi:hypothetical protein
MIDIGDRGFGEWLSPFRVIVVVDIIAAALCRGAVKKHKSLLI